MGLSWQATADNITGAAFQFLHQNRFGMRVVPDPFSPCAGDVIHPVLRLVRGRFARLPISRTLTGQAHLKSVYLMHLSIIYIYIYPTCTWGVVRGEVIQFKICAPLANWWVMVGESPIIILLGVKVHIRGGGRSL